MKRQEGNMVKKIKVYCDGCINEKGQKDKDITKEYMYILIKVEHHLGRKHKPQHIKDTEISGDYCKKHWDKIFDFFNQEVGIRVGFPRAKLEFEKRGR